MFSTPKESDGPASLPGHAPFRTVTVIALTLFLTLWVEQKSFASYWRQTWHTPSPMEAVEHTPFWQQGQTLRQSIEDMRLHLQAGVDQIDQEMVDWLNAQLGLDVTNSSLAAKVIPTPRPVQASTSPLSMSQDNETMLANVPLRNTPVSRLPVLPESSPDAASSRSPASSTHHTSLSQISSQAGAENSGTPPPLYRTAPPSPPASSKQPPLPLTTSDKVLLVGDSLMQGVAPHLVRTFHKHGIHAIDVSRQSTGLAYPSFYDWPQAIRDLVGKHRITTLVVMIGANDTWDLVEGNKFIPFGSDAWRNTYKRRVQAIHDFARDHQLRVVWLGLPNMKREKLNEGVPELNAIFEETMSSESARFLPTRELLGGKGNLYTKYVTLPDRGEVSVRAEDGVHFTPSGQKLIAQQTLAQFSLPEIPNLK